MTKKSGAREKAAFMQMKKEALLELVIGGRCQGKTAYVKEKYPRTRIFDEKDLMDMKAIEALPDMQEPGVCLVVNHLHLVIRSLMKKESTKEKIKDLFERTADKIPSLVFVSDEIGCGIVPMDAFERGWREETGRITTSLAKRAEQVTRVVCGIPQVLKRTDPPKICILLIRHAKTPGNERRCYIGSTDEGLSEKGRLNLEKTKDALSRLLGRSEERERSKESGNGTSSAAACMQDTGGTFTAFFASPMKRCTETAGILFPKEHFTVCRDLREIDFGDFEGKSAEDLKDDKRYQAFIDSGGTITFPGGEPREKFEKRTVRAFMEILTALMSGDIEEYVYSCTSYVPDDKSFCRSAGSATLADASGMAEMGRAGEMKKEDRKKEDRKKEEKKADHRGAVFVVHGGTIMSVLSFLTGRDYFDFQVPNGDGYLVCLHWQNGLFLPDSIRRLSSL